MRYLGAFDEDSDIDRPDLNKCPKCSCYFEQDACPICGEVCPEEMRAGNRKAVKVKKRKRSAGRDRVVFVEWYYSWWFILLMAFTVPIAALILLVTSPYSRKTKITVCVIAAVWMLISTVGLGGIIGGLGNLFDRPVDTSLSREEYTERCEKMTVETFYRTADDLEGDFITLTVEITDKTMDYDNYFEGGVYYYYYRCTAPDSSRFTILVRDCLQGSSPNFAVGDVVTFYGEGGGTVEFNDAEYNIVSGPCLKVAYFEMAE